MTRKASVLAPVLRSETQARLLAAVLLQPDREASIADLARETGSDPGNLHSEVERLVQAGILADRRVGRTRLLRAGDSALVGPLADLLLLGYGPKTAVEDALTDIPDIGQAFIGGSWAARYHGQAGAFPHDVDVIVVGKPNRDDVTEAVIEALRAVGHDGQVIFRSPTAWREAKDTFTRTAKDSPLVELTISNDDG
jgi:DNA-binding transcriptional ArsR family regulator